MFIKSPVEQLKCKHCILVINKKYVKQDTTNGAVDKEL